MIFVAYYLFYAELAALQAAGNMGNASLPVKSLPVESAAQLPLHWGVIRAAARYTWVHASVV
jgi:hypothetical protein